MGKEPKEMHRMRRLTQALLALLFLASGGAVASRAQGPPAAPPQDQGKTQAGPERHGDRGPDLNDPKLNLSDDQKTQITKILDTTRSQMQDLRNNSSLSREDKMEKMRQIRQDSNKQIEALLTPDQRKAWKEQQKERQEEWGEHHGHHEGEGAPPQQ
jgi:Spy/CpxP family protein refolding chaperone